MRLYLLLILLMPLSFAFAENSQYDYEQSIIETRRTMIYDLSKIDFQIIEVKKSFIPKWIDEPGDYSDILQVKFNVTNHELENFKIYKDMFQIDVVDLNQEFLEVRRTNDDYIIDNYYPEYIEDFKLRFQDMFLPPSLIDCTLLNDSVSIDQTKTLSVCFDVRQQWSNKPLNLDGPLLYYLVMMDNKSTTSCPNCITVYLNDYYQNPIVESELPPRKQLSLGISIKQISCKYGLELIFKNPENPACVKPKTAEILENRGWMQP